MLVAWFGLEKTLLKKQSITLFSFVNYVCIYILIDKEHTAERPVNIASPRVAENPIQERSGATGHQENQTPAQDSSSRFVIHSKYKQNKTKLLEYHIHPRYF